MWVANVDAHSRFDNAKMSVPSRHDNGEMTSRSAALPSRRITRDLSSAV
jgi:hypothetical protein